MFEYKGYLTEKLRHLRKKKESLWKEKESLQRKDECLREEKKSLLANNPADTDSLSRLSIANYSQFSAFMKIRILSLIIACRVCKEISKVDLDLAKVDLDLAKVDVDLAKVDLDLAKVKPELDQVELDLRAEKGTTPATAAEATKSG